MPKLLVALAATAALSIAPAAGTAAGPHYPSPAAVKRQALRDVKRRLRLATPPPGAHRVARAPKNAHLDGPGLRSISPNSLDRGRVWSVPGSPAQALAWVRAHPPANRPVKIEGGTGTPQHIVVDEIVFEWAPLPGRASQRWLGFAARRADGRTYLRADSQAIWIVPHPASAVIPPTARTLEVEVERSGGPVDRKTIGSRAKVREAARMIARLPAAQPGQRECGPGLESDQEEVTMVFRDGAGAAVAEAQQHNVGSWCGVLELTVEGKPQPLLEAEIETLEEVPGLLP